MAAEARARRARQGAGPFHPVGGRQHCPRHRASHLARPDGYAVQGAVRPLARPPARGVLMPAPHIISKVLGDDRIVHGFFGREGGRSMGDLASNNMSISQGDSPDLVVSNRSSAAYAMGGHGITDLVVFRQVHSTTVVTLTERPQGVIEADAMVTNRPDLLLGILTADCSPVLLADPDASIVGAAHAGWKGAAGGIVAATVRDMVALGAGPTH